MGIFNKELYCEGVFEWGFLDSCWSPTRIRVSDVDGKVERNGYFLIFEGKKPGQDIPKGQEIMFERESDTGRHTIVVLWGFAGVGQVPAVEHMQIYTSGGVVPKHPADNDDVWAFSRRWFEWANGQRRPRPIRASVEEDPILKLYEDYLKERQMNLERWQENWLKEVDADLQGGFFE